MLPRKKSVQRADHPGHTHLLSLLLGGGGRRTGAQGYPLVHFEASLGYLRCCFEKKEESTYLPGVGAHTFTPSTGKAGQSGLHSEFQASQYQLRLKPTNQLINHTIKLTTNTYPQNKNKNTGAHQTFFF